MHMCVYTILLYVDKLLSNDFLIKIKVRNKSYHDKRFITLRFNIHIS